MYVYVCTISTRPSFIKPSRRCLRRKVEEETLLQYWRNLRAKRVRLRIHDRMQCRPSSFSVFAQGKRIGRIYFDFLYKSNCVYFCISNKNPTINPSTAAQLPSFTLLISSSYYYSSSFRCHCAEQIVQFQQIEWNNLIEWIDWIEHCLRFATISFPPSSSSFSLDILL